jgi:4-hydroxybenzoate polyprenyltransferase
LADQVREVSALRTARVAATMLRYRIASLLVPFLLLGPALHGRLNGFRWSYVAAAVALCASYIVATCLNDIFDVEIDRINHPNAQDRPLVSGTATRGQLLAIAATFAIVALVSAATIGAMATAVVVASLLLNVAYSVPPLRLCARAVPAPAMLSIAYVAVPYGLGLSASGVAADWRDARVVACFVILFIGRMLLKDFRDRRGDEAFGKRTFLLTFGKRNTILAVLVCVLAGDVLLLWVLPPNVVLVAMIETYFAAILLQLYRLSQVTDADDERTAIALGARMGNAVVLTLLGVALLESAGAGPFAQSLFALLLGAMFWSLFAYISRRNDLPAVVNAGV